MSARASLWHVTLCLGTALAVGSAAAQDMRMVELNGLQIRVRVDGSSHIGKAPVVVFEAGGRSPLERPWQRERLSFAVVALGVAS